MTRLGEARAAGRITADELDERVESACRARTYGDLDQLLEDLPAGPDGAPGSSGTVRVGPESWPAQWLRGILDIAVLAAIAEGPTYGYEISARLERAGLGRVKGGTLYPLLSRLVEAGAVTTQWRDGEAGPGRKYFYLTTGGAARLDTQRHRWREFTGHTLALLECTGKEART